MSSFTTAGQMLGKRYQLTTEFPDQLPYEGVDVWNAVDTMLGTSVRIVAISPSSPFATDALDAARRSSLIDDPHVVQILSVGEDSEAHYVVTELPLGSPLSSYIHGVSFSAEQARAVVGEVASALNAARARGVRHLQLSSSVVRVGATGEVFVDGLGMNAALAGIHPDSLHSSEADRLEAHGLCVLLAQLLTGEPVAHSSLLSLVADMEDIPDTLRELCARESQDGGPSSTVEVVRELAPWGSVALSQFPELRESSPLSIPFSESERGNLAAFHEGDAGLSDGSSEARDAAFPLEDSPANNEGTDVDPLSDEVLSPSGFRPQWASLDEFAQEHPEEVDPEATAIFQVEEIEEAQMAAAREHVIESTDAAEASDKVAEAASVVNEAGMSDNAFSPFVPPVFNEDSHVHSPSGVEETPSDERLEGASASQDFTPSGQVASSHSSISPTFHAVDNQGTQDILTSEVPAQSRSIQSVPSIASLTPAGSEVSRDTSSLLETTKRPDDFPAQTTQQFKSSAAGQAATETKKQTERIPAKPSSYVGRPAPSIPESELAGEVVPPKKYSSSKVVVLGAVISLVLMGAWAVKTFFSPTNIPDRPSPRASTSAPAEPSSATNETKPAEDLSALPAPSISGITILNPYASGLKDPAENQDNPKMLPFLTDGKAETYWQTWYYPDASFGGTKKGVGLAIKLSERSRVSSVTINSPLSGGTVQWRASSPTSPDSGEVLAESSLSSGTVLTPSQAQGTDTIVLWFPTLSPIENTFRIRISEISVQ